MREDLAKLHHLRMMTSEETRRTAKNTTPGINVYQ